MLPYSSQPTEQHKSKILQVTNTVVVPQKTCASLLFSADRTAQVKGITNTVVVPQKNCASLLFSADRTAQVKGITNTVVVPQKTCASLLFSADRTAQVKDITGYKHCSSPSENLCFLTLLNRQNSTSQRYYRLQTR